MLREIQPPTDAQAVGDQFVFVRVLVNGAWRPALLTAWIRTPTGWACRLRTPRYRAANGTVTRDVVYLFDPTLIQPLSAGDIRPTER